MLAQPAISSQLIDNLNASSHLRALLTDLFLISEIVRTRAAVTGAGDAEDGVDAAEVLANLLLCSKKKKKKKKNFFFFFFFFLEIESAMVAWRWFPDGDHVDAACHESLRFAGVEVLGAAPGEARGCSSAGGIGIVAGGE